MIMRVAWKAIVGIGIALAGALTGCGRKEQRAEEVCQFSYFYDCGSLPDTWDMNQPIMQTITEATGCMPVLNHPKEDADAKLNLMIMQEDLPDLVTTGNTELVQKMIDAGLVWELDEFLQTYLPDSHLLQEYPQDVKTALTVRDGGWYSYASHITSDDMNAIWGIPDSLAEYVDEQKYANQFSIFFRKEYLEQIDVNVKDIDTEEELLDVLQMLADADLKNEDGQAVYPLMIHGNQYQAFTLEALNMHFGVLPVDKDGNYQSVYYNDNFKHVMQFLNQCAQRGYINESMITMDESTFTVLCDDGRAACFIGGLYALHGDLDADWCTPGPVQSSTGAQPVFGVPYTLAGSTGWLHTMVSKQTEYPEEIACFLDYMTSREGMLAHIYGMEEEDYYWDEDNFLHRTEAGEEKIEDGVSGMGGFWGFHCGSFAYSVEGVDISKISDIRVAFGCSEKAYLYDSDLLSYPVDYVFADSEAARIKDEEELYTKQMLSTILFAEDDTEFEELYMELREHLDEIGLRRYDSYINEMIQKNYKAYGKKIVDINAGGVGD